MDLLSLVKVGVGIEVSDLLLYVLGSRDHVPDQQLVVLHHGPDGQIYQGSAFICWILMAL